LIVFLSPVFLFIAIAIKLNSNGGIFFKQIRITAYGKEFRIVKFRTMVARAETIGSQITIKNDIRVTKVGKILRKYHLDEIPQLINILCGEMSFVGTRPEVARYVAKYTPIMKATLLLPAGVTSEACIRYKDENDLLQSFDNVDDTYMLDILPVKMEYNLISLKTFSFLNDIMTMVRTVFAVLGKRRKKYTNVIGQKEMVREQ
jgi:lipopolysaccharide/colanic/teichoic acid biosynthesis glycosyltransferase